MTNHAPRKISADEAQARANRLYRELRCPVCRHQSIADSDAPLATDMRALVLEKLQNGESEEDIKNYLVARYGEFVLFRPRWQRATYALWSAPLLVLVVAVGTLFWLHKRKRTPPP